MRLLITLVVGLLFAGASEASAVTNTMHPGAGDSGGSREAQALAFMKKGMTLPMGLTEALTSPVDLKKRPAGDTGINVLIDQSHQTTFALLWHFAGFIRGMGHRVCTSLASLDTVLVPGKPSRIRKSVGGADPFAWWRTAEFNVVITEQHDLSAPPYTPAEVAALTNFIAGGGGLMVFAGRPKSADPAAWSLNSMVAGFGAGLTTDQDMFEGNRCTVLKLSPEWTVDIAGSSGKPVRARRTFSKGRVVIMEGLYPVKKKDGELDSDFKKRNEVFDGLLKWLAGGKPVVGGDWRMPNTGSAGIFPEKEMNLGSVVVYYASNQTSNVVSAIERDIPRAAKQILEWFPCTVYEEPYHMVLCAGRGGGWELNARPKAAAVIESEPLTILGVFGHEMAHTKGGPVNTRKELAGFFPQGNTGEEHAGWFQGKIGAFFNPASRSKPNRDCNRIFDVEKAKGHKVDIANYDLTLWGSKNSKWLKTWWIWQKMDDRYGSTWYPRWFWVRSMRWMDDPKHKETWDEAVEDMCIAVGEDVFPFFNSIGTTLTHKRLERTTFLGRQLELPVAPLDDGPAGPVCLEAIGDYTKPLIRKQR